MKGQEEDANVWICDAHSGVNRVGSSAVCWRSIQFASGQSECYYQGQWKWSRRKLDDYKDVKMSFPAARMLRTVVSSSSSVSQQVKALLCGASCLITTLEWARMWQSSSSINIT